MSIQDSPIREAVVADVLSIALLDRELPNPWE